MNEIIKNLFRRRTRTLLTIFGITIGIFAFVVMGSMAEKISLLVNGGTKYYSDKVTIQAAGSSLTSMPTPMNISKLAEIQKVEGVKAVSATVLTLLNDSGTSISFGPPDTIVGTDFAGSQYETFKITYSQGRALRPGDSQAVVVGADLVNKLKAKVGGTVTIKGYAYKVVGIIGKTLTAPDNEVWMTLPDAQKLMYASLPPIIKQQTQASTIVNGFTVYPNSGVDPNELAKKINAQVKDVNASGPKAFQDQVAAATGIFNAILFGIALISLLVGGLSVINTMTMSISERIREIGIKKAVGAKTRNIMSEYLMEAGLIGLFGGLIGWAIGAAVVLTLNHFMGQSGNIIFLLTARISIFAIIFSAVLGVIAGIYPSYYAVRVNIVKALREA
ncbi:MAG: ABC transporter permease [Candidatus Saccharimonadia bacterium]